jgi:uncharacterized protein YgiM (DUF1202 family)
MKRNLALATIMLLGSQVLHAGETTESYYRATSNANVRAAPTTNSQRIGFLEQGTRVRVIGSAAGPNWQQVRLASGQMGFVYGPLLKREETAASESGKSDRVGGPTPAPEDAFCYIIWPNNGEVIPGGDFVVLFGLHGMGVAPAGVDKQYTGHHHLLIDTDLPPLNKEIPSDDHHIHFGLGETEYRLKLPPGPHTLQLLLGDAHHVPHNPPGMSEKITIRVP